MKKKIEMFGDILEKFGRFEKIWRLRNVGLLIADTDRERALRVSLTLGPTTTPVLNLS